MTYHDWQEEIGRGRPKAFEVANKDQLTKLFGQMKLSS